MTEELDLVAHKTRAHLNNKQSSWMRDNCIGCRLAYNFAIDKLRNSKKGEGEFPTAYSVSKQWTQERDERHPWMKAKGLNLDTVASVFSTRYAPALNNWKRAGWAGDKAPKFHGRGARLTSTWRGRTIKQVSANVYALPNKRGTFRIGEPLRFDGELRSVTFSFEGGKWYASFLIKTKLPKPAPAPEGTAIGVDLGVAKYATLSNGTHYEPLASFGPDMAKLAKLQRQLSRMEGPIKGQRKASRNWLKQRAKVDKQYRRMANKRRDYAENLTKALAEGWQIVAIEDLKLKNMTASAKGDAETPGKNVRQKAGLNRSLLNGAFHQFRTRLEAKVGARGGQVIPVNPAYTSQTCPACGHVAKENRPDQATFRCIACGYEANADVNAAQNILHRAFADDYVDSMAI